MMLLLLAKPREAEIWDTYEIHGLPVLCELANSSRNQRRLISHLAGCCMPNHPFIIVTFIRTGLSTFRNLEEAIANLSELLQ